MSGILESRPNWSIGKEQSPYWVTRSDSTVCSLCLDSRVPIAFDVVVSVCSTRFARHNISVYFDRPKCLSLCPLADKSVLVCVLWQTRVLQFVSFGRPVCSTLCPLTDQNVAVRVLLQTRVSRFVFFDRAEGPGLCSLVIAFSQEWTVAVTAPVVAVWFTPCPSCFVFGQREETGRQEWRLQLPCLL